MQSINTDLTRLMHLKTPIVAAPMYGASTPDLAAAVATSGGFGFIAAGFDSSETIKKNLRSIRASLNLPEDTPLPTGVGFMGWMLDKTEASDDPRIPVVLKESPVAVWLGFGSNLGRYVAQVRAYDAGRAHKTLVFVLINSAEEALQAVNDWKVDALVVQGIEAGGHGSATAPPLFQLLQAVLQAVPNGPPILAAGGISTGSQIAALLTMGASGVALGTRFLFTPECAFSDVMKSVLVDAGLDATTRSYAFDEVRGITAWPKGNDGRAIANDIISDYRKELSLETRVKKYHEGNSKGEKDRLIIWAGVGAGLVKDIRKTSDVIQQLHDETIESLTKAGSLVASRSVL